MAYWVFKALLTPVFVLLWRVRVEGHEHIPAKGAAVLAANHQSFCDSMFIPLVVRRRVTFLAKAEYFDSWRTAWFFRSAGQIPVRRGGGDQSQRALDTGFGVLERGRLLAMYPEGTRSPDRVVHRGRTGVVRLALRSGAPIIPVGIEGTEEIQPAGSRLMRPFKVVTVRFGPPLDPGGASVSGGEAQASWGLPEREDDTAQDDTAQDDTAQDDTAQDDTASVRAWTDQLMAEIARLSGRHYLDRYLPVPATKNAAPSDSGPPPGEPGPEAVYRAPPGVP